MFHSVRHWWSEGRGKLTVRMFLFEFLVVVAGVLVAQGLADAVRGRAERAEAERLRASVVNGVRMLQRDYNYWGRFGPCLRGHVARIARIAAAGGTMPNEEIGRPALPTPLRFDLSADEWRKVRLVSPDEQVDAFASLSGSADTYRDFLKDIARQWAVLRLLSPETGMPSAEDRAQVRLAAMQIDNNVRWMIFQHRVGAKTNMADAKIAETGFPNSVQLVDRCGLLKQWQ